MANVIEDSKDVILLAAGAAVIILIWVMWSKAKDFTPDFGAMVDKLLAALKKALKDTFDILSPTGNGRTPLATGDGGPELPTIYTGVSSDEEF